MNNNSKIIGFIAWLICFWASPVFATDWGSEKVTMEVGETKTLYLPSSVTSKSLISVAFYSASYNVVEVVSYNSYSVKVKALKPTSTAVIVRCDYYYYINRGGYIYQNGGAYDFNITVKDDTTRPTKIDLPDVISIEVGESMDIIPDVTPKNAEYELTWTISDSSIATIGFVDGIAMITGKSVGYTDLKVKADNGVYKMCRISVYKPTPTSIDATSILNLSIGSTAQINVEVKPLNSQYKLTWSSSNPSVASVSQTGFVRALAAGSTTITVLTDNGKMAICNVFISSPKNVLIITDLEGLTNIPSKADVEYERNFFEGWNSICVPFAFSETDLKSFAEGMKIAVYERKIEDEGCPIQIALKEVSSVNAGVPCLVYSPKDVICKFNYKDVSLVSTPDNSGPLKGSFEQKTIGKGKYKLADSSQMGITTTDDAACFPFRAYLDL